MTASRKLLEEYVQNGSEAAFRELVDGYVNLVFSAALRLTDGDTHLAEDVAQTVFLDLARNARTLSRDVMLGGWLHRHTIFVAANTLRGERRRQARERTAMEMNALEQNQAGDFSQIAPMLDEALDELREDDRQAILLRFFEQRDFRAIGESLGSNEDAARMRVNRALEKLESALKRRGVTSTAAALSIALTATAVQSAPAGLSASIASAVFAGTATTSAVVATTKIIAMTTLQKVLVTAAITVAVGAGVYEAQQAAHWRDEFRKLQQSQQTDVARLQKERDASTKQAAALQEQMGRTKSNDAELLRLRAKLTQLSNGSVQASTPAQNHASVAAQLKAKLAQMSKYGIPELKFASETNWEAAAAKFDLSTDEGVRRALSEVRQAGIDKFLNEMMKDAMKKYLAANNNIAPPDLYVLKPYFDEPVTDEMLSHYKLVQTGTVDNNRDLVRLTFHADDEYDSNHGMSISGAWGGGYNNVRLAVGSAFASFFADNSGQLPTDASQLQSYFKQPMDAATVQKYLDEMAAHPPPPEFATVYPAMQAYSAANNGAPPSGPLDVLPYLTSPEQMNALKKLDQDVATIAPALDAYAAANNGQLPHGVTDLIPYLSTPEQQATYRKLVKDGGAPHP